MNLQHVSSQIRILLSFGMSILVINWAALVFELPLLRLLSLTIAALYAGAMIRDGDTDSGRFFAMMTVPVLLASLARVLLSAFGVQRVQELYLLTIFFMALAGVTLLVAFVRATPLVVSAAFVLILASAL